MNSINRLLVCLVSFVIAATAVRFWLLSDYYQHTANVLHDPEPPNALRQNLFLDGGHKISRLIAVHDKNRDASVAAEPSWRIAWFTASPASSDTQPFPIRGTAIIRDLNGIFISADISSLLGPSLDSATEFLTHHWLSGLRNADIRSLPNQTLRHRRLDLATWDDTAPVFVTAGPDNAPGIVNHDDDGNGVLDDLGELGITGSDDFVVAPGQPGYEAASTGQTISRLISRGAVVDVPPGQPITVIEPAEIWLDFDRHETSNRQIILRLQ